MISKHAQQRMQARAISPLVVDLLYRYGSERHQNGSTVLYFDQRTRRKALDALKDTLKRFDKLDDVYVVMATDDGSVITAGHLHKRLRNR